MKDAWEELLDIAVDILTEAGAARTGWVWGGGTVLMLRYRHRISKDIDLFLNDPQLLTMMSPRLNDGVAKIVSNYSESANHLRLEIAERGEIDFLLAAPVIQGEPETMTAGSHNDIQVMADREILAQKLYYRSAGFTGRDLYDFAIVTGEVPTLLADMELHRVALLRKESLLERLSAESMKAAFDAVVRHPECRTELSFDQARTELEKWLAAPLDQSAATT